MDTVWVFSARSASGYGGVYADAFRRKRHGVGCLLSHNSKQTTVREKQRTWPNVNACGTHVASGRPFTPLPYERWSEGRQATALRKAKLVTRIQAKYTLLLETGSQVRRSVLVSLNGQAPRIPVRSPSHVCAPPKVSGTAEVRQTVPGPDSLLGSRSQSNTEAVSHSTFWGFLQE